MKAFGELYEQLDSTTSINAKLAALVRYFRSAPAHDAAWAIHFLSGRRLKRVVGSATLRQWLLDESGLPEWLLEETYSQVGDLAETIALLVERDGAHQPSELSLSAWIERLLGLPGMTPAEQQGSVVHWWKELDARGCFLLNKILTGELRVGVSAGMVERALAEVTQLPRTVIAHRLMGVWQPGPKFWAFINAPADAGDRSRPYPFCLASPLEAQPETLGPVTDWLVEWKWDGIRAQVMRRDDGTYVWSRGEELITDRFPEIVRRAAALPPNTVIDGEILAWRDGVRPFGELQQRIGRRKLTAKILETTPVQLLAYDLLELDGVDLRLRPMSERRELLERLLQGRDSSFDVSALVTADDWDALRELRSGSRERFVEGMMLKRRDSAYGTGRQRGAWWKWKIEPYTFDGVLVYAQPGRGRRANLLTDYTFAVHDGDKLVPVAKAYSGLTDSEIARVDRWIRQNTVERFGPVRSVKPELVFEIAFEAINESGRHKSGVAVRFPRIARWREDKPAAEANTLADLRGLLRVDSSNADGNAAGAAVSAGHHAKALRLSAMDRIERWFATRGWHLAAFQKETIAGYLAGESGLVHAPTGSGKTLAAWLGPLSAEMQSAASGVGLRVLWITPLRALANDIHRNLVIATEALGVPWEIGLRTGDTSSTLRKKQRERPPQGLVTTPESLSVLLSFADSHDSLRTVQAVIVDEWHELMGSKRGVQLELCLSHLRALNPRLQTWGLSATLGNLDEALTVLMGREGVGRMIHGPRPREVSIESVLPPTIERFPWAGHMGTRLLQPVLEAIDAAQTTLVFTNTRSQAEIWYRAIAEARLDWIDRMAIHHGSISLVLRRRIEAAVQARQLKCVVCTSSLDLGVDFAPVDQVLQIGSPKGVARLLQRAGRSGHQPDGRSRVLCVPTHAFELVEFAAARLAQSLRRIEARRPLRRSLDVLLQHAMTLAAGPGFAADRLLAEVRSSHAFAELTDLEWQWVLDFLTRGGDALQGYPQYRRLDLDDGVYRVGDARLARLHRMSIGTITSDAEIAIKWLNGAPLGSVEESLIARMKPGAAFMFAGRVLELVRVKDMAAYVRLATSRSGRVAKWQGGRLPLSNELADSVQELLEHAAHGRYEQPELARMRPLLELQQRWSQLPTPDMLLIEYTRSREGHHVFVYPFAGRTVNEGIATLMAHRWAQLQPITFSITANDYGAELLTGTPIEIDASLIRRLLARPDLGSDLLASLNFSEVARRQFRDIARIAGLVFQGYPGARKLERQLQASSGLIFDVLREYDPRNLLLEQARREVFELQLEETRLARALEELEKRTLVLSRVESLTPLSFPVWAERLRSQILSTETFQERIQRMIDRLERRAARG